MVRCIVATAGVAPEMGLQRCHAGRVAVAAWDGFGMVGCIVATAKQIGHTTATRQYEGVQVGAPQHA